MEIISIEPTPSPLSMKIVVNEALPSGKNERYTKENIMAEAPDYAKKLIAIEGVKGFYRVADFIAIDRDPKIDWKPILSKVRQAFGEEDVDEHPEEAQASLEGFGEVKVFIQKFRNIPIQVKMLVDGEEKRVGLPPRFMEAIMKAQVASTNMIMERQWVEQTPRYGDDEEIAKDMVEEISAAYDEERLDALVNRALSKDTTPVTSPFIKVSPEMLNHTDWRERYKVLERMEPTVIDIPILEKALGDEKVAIRRLATVYLGMIEDEKVLPYLYRALKDKTVTVRRTAGDCLSDIGNKAAIPAMVEALQDPSKIVRWRAAMFLYEVGDESALEALRNAEDDPEFEVALQVKMALERIEKGEEAKGSVWKQMTETIQGLKNNS